MMRHILIYSFLVLMSCDNAQDETALFQDAFSAIFESLLFPLEIRDPSVSRTLTKDLDEDVIRHELNYYRQYKESLDRNDFDLEQSISMWEKYKGKDLSVYVADKHRHFLIPEDSIIDRGTKIGFSAPVFNNDTSMFFLYMVFEIIEENTVYRSHQYFLYMKENESWKWIMATSNHPNYIPKESEL